MVSIAVCWNREAEKSEKQRSIRINIIGYNLAEMMEHNFRMKKSYRGSKMGSGGREEKEGNKILGENVGSN